ncbi:hypothetical protein OEZ85_007127 [Tetradesmus obliquus]|uniref:Uncharacterized protein n=1 Tax=Tetradesmus obliquus TaxID=3088 RepID=A0ABY8TWQ0_TETOB|nr:hypothetical protein OEZ85_007127 [Tetradesmus obliquus]
MPLLARAQQPGHMRMLHGSRLNAHISRVQLRATAIHKEYSKGGLKDKPPSNVLLATPEDIVIECLTLMRKGELSQLSPYIPQHLLAAPEAPVQLAGVPVHEQGPLARCAPFMDTAARRVLPGHLLRRARILSSLQLGGSCLLRVSLTACTGEELSLDNRAL